MILEKAYCPTAIAAVFAFVWGFLRLHPVADPSDHSHGDTEERAK